MLRRVGIASGVYLFKPALDDYWRRQDNGLVNAEEQLPEAQNQGAASGANSKNAPSIQPPSEVVT